jgi:hypothetical protein
VPGLDRQVCDVAARRRADVLADDASQPAPDLAAMVMHVPTVSAHLLGG